MKTSLVIFDMDGLMFDTETVSCEAWKLSGEKNGYVIDKNMFMNFLGTNHNSIKNLLIKSFGSDAPIDTIISDRNNFAIKLITENGLGIKKGLKELLKYLKENNIKRAVATSTSKTRALELLTIAGIESDFNYIICGDEVTKSKPDPEIFLKAAEKLNCLPSECIVLEDSRFGIQAARSAGMRGILVPDMLEPDTEMLKNSFKKVDNLLQVIDIINSESE